MAYLPSEHHNTRSSDLGCRKSGCVEGVSFFDFAFVRVCLRLLMFARVYLCFGPLFREPDNCVCLRLFAFAKNPFHYTPFCGTLSNVVFCSYGLRPSLPRKERDDCTKTNLSLTSSFRKLEKAVAVRNSLLEKFSGKS